MLKKKSMVLIHYIKKSDNFFHRFKTEQKNNPGFNEMSRLNTYMLSFIYPDSYKEKTFHIEDEPKKDNKKHKES